MVTTIECIYENGQVILAEEPMNKGSVKVFVLFTDEKIEKIVKQRPFGLMKGSVNLRADFNEPLDDLKEYM